MRSSKNKYLFLIPVFLILVSIAFFSGYFIFRNKETAVGFGDNHLIQSAEIEKKEDKFYRSLDGVEVENKEEVNPYLIGIVIDNFTESRPLSGLSEANLVYEFLTEAGITRFLAFYTPDKEVIKIGPVRSARPYFLDLSEEYGSLFMHVGGSPAALESLKNKEYSLYNLDQFFNAQYFWRLKTKKAPFNVYTSSDLFQRALKEKGAKPSELSSWQFKEDLNPENRPIKGKDLAIEYSYPEYQVKWKYDAEKNDYLREQENKIYLEEDEKQIRAKNIIVQTAKTTILDKEGRKEIKIIGEGNAFIFQDGGVIKGTWQKFRKGDRTNFFDENGREIKFNRGITWVEVAPDEKIISY
ncbi:MAG: hypothetical protein Athens101410_54 [Parcubacteria group bacterium Athens1014_10]|nr:MAG: hypothetical protein Athens101410_54 [Parcubacteria group bacterium Athens1014_10]TSD06080.1 MAG: hypothetical protein Athens071412_54 [Parcubacteria group bacterium Athens0714_12]